ncbi:MAG TPA: prolipoprotein diacylglyceryl transferase [Nitrospirota bacterium]|nr:prolipoprotein diacylglyceryl transferase [Nitrospirota bacterium]
MHPILFEIPKIEIGNWIIGPIPIRMYGLMIGIGFLLGIYLASRRAKKEGLDQDLILDMGVYLLLAAIIGSRVLYVLTTLQEFTRNPLDAFAIWKGGLVFYGGLLAAVPVGIWYVKKHSLPVWKTSDIMAPYVALGHAFGRLGCFFAGCCYGAPCSGPFCITFNDSHSLAPLGVPLFPTQLMESGGEFFVFGALLILRRYKRFDGQLFWLYSIFYAVLRFSVEFFRGDAVRGLYFGGLISTSQIIAVLMFGFSLFMFWKLGKAEKETT